MLLLYPLLERQPRDFELRRFCHVLKVDYDREARQATCGVYALWIDVITGEDYFQPADVVMLWPRSTMTNNHLLLTGVGIGRPYDPQTRTGVVGQEFLLPDLLRHATSS